MLSLNPGQYAYHACWAKVRDAFDRFEIARDGKAEIESVKVRNGRLYLEFHSGNARKEKGVVTSVFQFDLPQELSL